jgi:hypothetical protein
MVSLLSLLLGDPVLALVRCAPFRPERTDNFPVAANETAADMLCCALYPRIQTSDRPIFICMEGASSQWAARVRGSQNEAPAQGVMRLKFCQKACHGASERSTVCVIFVVSVLEYMARLNVILDCPKSVQ